MKAKGITKMSDEELKLETASLRKSLWELRCQAVTEKLENPRQLPNLRHDIARLLTERQRRRLQTQRSA